MNSIRRKPRPPSERRASARPRTEARRAARSFEGLEARFLLSGSASALKPVVMETTDLKVVKEDLAPKSASQNARADTAPLAVPASPARDDSFALPDGEEESSVHVDLLWPEGSEPADGHLLVSDASGKVFYDLPLTGVETLHAELPIPSSRASSTTLDLDLAIHRATPTSASSGSYQVAIHWGKPSEPVVTVWTPNAPPPSSPPPFSSSPAGLPDQAFPSITATRSLPSFVLASDTSGGSGGRNGPSDPSGFIGPPALPRMGGVPAGPTTGPTATTPTTGSTSSAPSSPVPAPSPAVPGHGSGEGSRQSSGEGGQGSRPAVVGPLPLNGSNPDGGIFAFPIGVSRASNDPFQATFTTNPAPPRDGTSEPSTDAPLPRQLRLAMPFPNGPRSARPSLSGPFEQEMEVARSATGVAFLPPIEDLAGVSLARASSPEVKVSNSFQVRTSLAYPPRSRASLSAVLIGSAGFLLGLFAPGGVARLTTWQDDRRWVRRKLGVSSKKPPNIPPEV